MPPDAYPPATDDLQALHHFILKSKDMRPTQQLGHKLHVLIYQ